MAGSDVPSAVRLPAPQDEYSNATSFAAFETLPHAAVDVADHAPSSSSAVPRSVSYFGYDVASYSAVWLII